MEVVARVVEDVAFSPKESLVQRALRPAVNEEGELVLVEGRARALGRQQMRRATTLPRLGHRREHRIGARLEPRRRHPSAMKGFVVRRHFPVGFWCRAGCGGGAGRGAGSARKILLELAAVFTARREARRCVGRDGRVEILL